MGDNDKARKKRREQNRRYRENNPDKSGIIGYLREHGPATRAEIASGLDLPIPTIAASLKAMVDAGLLTSVPRISEVRRGQRVRYDVDQEMVSRMYLQLGQAIGEL